MTPETINQIMRMYGRKPAAQLPVEKGYRNENHPILLDDGSLINVIIYKSEPVIVQTIRNANNVSNFLAERDFPARRTLDDRILRLNFGDRSKYAAVYNYLPGQTIAWEAYTMKHLKLLGGGLSDMHAALRDFDMTALPDVVDVYLEIFARMQRYFAASGVRAALVKKLGIEPPGLDAYIAALKAYKHLPDQQALHMDFVRSNILFDDPSGELVISGILDFEKTARGHRLFDVARTLAFLLVDCKYKSPEKVRKYFLQSGYIKRGAADLQNVSTKTKTGEISVLENLVTLFLLHDFYKFLRHNPYESLPQNEHFVATCGLLRGHGVLLGIALRLNA